MVLPEVRPCHGGCWSKHRWSRKGEFPAVKRYVVLEMRRRCHHSFCSFCVVMTCTRRGRWGWREIWATDRLGVREGNSSPPQKEKVKPGKQTSLLAHNNDLAQLNQVLSSHYVGKQILLITAASLYLYGHLLYLLEMGLNSSSTCLVSTVLVLAH